MKIDNIPTGVFDEILKRLVKSGWVKTYEYDNFDKGIDFDKIILAKEGRELTFEWDNWMEGEVNGQEVDMIMVQSLIDGGQ